jgi:hypothetical protein
MNTHHLPAPIPLARPWPARWFDSLRVHWLAWQARRAQAAAWRQACQLSAQALEDIAAPEDWRHTAAHCRDRQRMERELLRVGIVPGAPW